MHKIQGIIFNYLFFSTGPFQFFTARLFGVCLHDPREFSPVSFLQVIKIDFLT